MNEQHVEQRPSPPAAGTPSSDPTPSGPSVDKPTSPESAKPTESSWWGASFKAAPFRAISLLTLTLGGLMLLMFFVRLGTVPDLDLASTTASMAAVAVIGLLLVTFIGGSTIAAGLMTRTLVGEGRQQGLRPLDFVLLALPGLLTVTGLIATVYKLISWPVNVILWIGLGTMLVAQAARHCATWHAEGGSKPYAWIWPLFGRVGVAFVWFALDVFAFLTLYAFWPTERDATSFSIVLIVWALLCSSLNAAMVLWPNRTRLEEAIGIVLLSILGFLGLSALSENWTGVPVAAVRALGLGEQAVGVVVTAAGCDTFNKVARGQVVCQLDSEHKTGWVCPVVLRSRIGSPYVFELTSFDAHGNWPAQARSSPSDSDTSRVLKRIQIAKEDVKSWPSIDALKVNDDARRSTAVAVDSLRVLTYLDQRLLNENDIQRKWLVRQCGSSSGVATAATRQPHAPAKQFGSEVQ